MSLNKAKQLLCSDEAEGRAVERKIDKPSFIKAASVLGHECMVAAKLSELPLKEKSRSKLLSLIGGTFEKRKR